MTGASQTRAGFGPGCGRGHSVILFVVVCLFGMGVGALNEVVEFAASHLLNAKNVGGYENTGRDLVSNLLGSLTAGIVVSRQSGKGA